VAAPPAAPTVLATEDAMADTADTAEAAMVVGGVAAARSCHQQKIYNK